MDKKGKAKEIIDHAAISAASSAAVAGLLAGAGGADVVVLTSIYTKLIYDLAQLFDAPVTEDMIANLLGLATGAEAGVTGTKWVLSWIPIVGSAVGASINAITTKSFGWTVYKYFEDQNNEKSKYDSKS